MAVGEQPVWRVPFQFQTMTRMCLGPPRLRKPRFRGERYEHAFRAELDFTPFASSQGSIVPGCD